VTAEPLFIEYTPKSFSAEREAIIEQVNEILEQYAEAGYDLTLRQVYYQFVARGLIPNQAAEYKRLGAIINDARLAGRVPWNRIVDRTRNLQGVYHVADAQQAITEAARDFHTDLWATQKKRVEVWVEKDALIGVVGQACQPWDVNYFSCRGYCSQSELWAAAMRLLKYVGARQEVIILHLGDHDPSGIDMTRDISDRLSLFASEHLKPLTKLMGFHQTHRLITVKRIALNADQIERYDPPPNPTKLTDSRAKGYISEYGRESWELDALEPTVLNDLIQTHIKRELDGHAFAEAYRAMEKERKRLTETAEHWHETASGGA